MKINIVGPFKVNAPFASEIAFAKGLRSVGHEVVEFDPNLDSPDVLARDADCTLVFKTALSHNSVLEGLRNVVLYQPDDLDFPHIREMVSQMRRYSEHLLLFRRLDPALEPDISGFVRSLQFKSVGYIGLTADPDIYYPEDVEKDIDFCFIGSMGDPRCHWQRRRMFEVLTEAGFNVAIGQTNDVNEIRSIYNRSKVVLNHAADYNGRFGLGKGYQCRHYEAGMTGACLLSNSVQRIYEKDVNEFLTFYDEQSLVRWGSILMDNPDMAREQGKFLYNEVMLNHSPAVRALELTVRLGIIL